MTDRTGGTLFVVVMALAAAAGMLLIEDDTARVAFLVAVCVLLLVITRQKGESTSPGAEGVDFLVPVVAAILVSSLAFEDDQQKFASVIVLALLFSVAWRAMRAKRGQSA